MERIQAFSLRATRTPVRLQFDSTLLVAAKIVRPRITTAGMSVYEMGWPAAEVLLKQVTDGREERDEIMIRGQFFIRDSSGSEEAHTTKDESISTAAARRIMQNKQPED